ncbi:MAG: hypothetical protein MJ211_09990 [Bacteroidales bacterium]|nr:hypothetical protein [Bacteroidales bacterium]
MEQIEQQKVNSYPELRGEDRTTFAEWVVSTHRKLHNNRQQQVELAQKIDTWRAINQDVNSNLKIDDKIQEGFRDAKFSTMCFIDKAQVGKESWTNIDQMYEVNATDANLPPDEAREITDKQKYALNKALKDSKADIEFDKAYDYFQQWGELISWVGWQQKTILKKVADINYDGGYRDITIKEENAHMSAIDPMFFEFDTATYKPDDKDNWDSLIKIHKRFEPVSKIVNAKYFDEITQKNVPLYKLTKEQEQELKEKDTKIDDTEQKSQLATKNIYGNSYEVLFLHGDFVFKGKEYKNYIAEVYAGKYLIRFCPNPYYICPFILVMPEVDPKTRRGIAKMKSIIYSCEQRQNEINQILKLSKLNTNPPVIGSKTAIRNLLQGKDKGVIDWQPGMTIAVEDFAATNETKPITFENGYTETNIAFITNEISDNGGVNANAMGNVEKQDRKATDLNLAKAGQDTRLSKTLDVVYQFIIKNIEAFADIIALFRYGVEFIRVFDKKEQVEKIIEINDLVRQGHYQYEYNDRNAITARKDELNAIYPLLEKGVQGGIVDGKEALKMILEVYGFDGADKIFKQDDQLAQIIAQIPPEMRDMAAQYLQQGIQQYQQQQEQQKMQERVNKNATRKIMQEQADLQAQMQLIQEQGLM